MGFGGHDPVPDGSDSLSRFVRAVRGVKEFVPGEEQSAVATALGILNDVSMGDTTKWSIVCDIQGGVIHFRTHTRESIRYVDITRLDFACTTPVRMLDINLEATANVTDRFVDYTEEVNRNLIQTAFAKMGTSRAVPEIAVNMLAVYPDLCPCEDEKATQAQSGVTNRETLSRTSVRADSVLILTAITWFWKWLWLIVAIAIPVVTAIVRVVLRRRRA